MEPTEVFVNPLGIGVFHSAAVAALPGPAETSPRLARLPHHPGRGYVEASGWLPPRRVRPVVSSGLVSPRAATPRVSRWAQNGTDQKSSSSGVGGRLSA